MENQVQGNVDTPSETVEVKEDVVRVEVPETVLEAFPAAFEGMSQNLLDGLIDELCPIIKEESLLEIDFNESRKTVVLLSNPYRVPDEMTYYSPNATNHTATRRVVVITGGGSQAINKAITQALLGIDAWLVDTMPDVPVYEPIPYSWKGMCIPAEWRWTDLHAKLSLEGSVEKFKRQQQRQKSLFKHHQEKRLKGGRSHAKQKHKGMSRYA